MRFEDSSRDEAGLSLIEVLGRVRDPRSAHGTSVRAGGGFGIGACAPCCAERAVHAISQWGQRSRSGSSPRPWGSPGSGTPCGPRCTAGFRGWIGRHLKGCWGNGCRSAAGQRVRRWPLTVKGCGASTVISCPGCIWWPYAHQAGIVVGQQAVGESEERVGRRSGSAGAVGPERSGGNRRCPVHPAGGVPADRGSRGHYFLAVKHNQPTRWRTSRPYGMGRLLGMGRLRRHPRQSR